MPQPINTQSLLKEGKILLAKLAIDQNQIHSERSAVKSYNAVRTTLQRRRAGIHSRRDCIPNRRLLTDLEEEVLKQHILDLHSRGHPPNLARVGDMANSILAGRGGRKVGQKWPRNFVNRQPDLKTRYNRKYDHQRAKMEDPRIITPWFDMVRHFKAEHGIPDDDVYNFDETGFQMGVIGTELVVTGTDKRNHPKTIQPGNREWVTAIAAINALGWAIPPYIIFAGKTHLSAWYEGDDIPGDWPIGLSDNGWTNDKLGLEWLKHFDKHTKNRTKGTKRLLILDGHGSHDTAGFHIFCRENNIISLCMPAHSSHLLQPLDVGCFAPLKKAYGNQISELMRSGINHITKLEFLPAFRAAFDASITPDNIRGGFRGAGLVPDDPEAVLSKLDVRLRTPTPVVEAEAPWSAKTPGTHAGFTAQTELITGRITRHQGSSPTAIIDAVNQVLKGTLKLAAELQLSKAEVLRLRKANEAATRRKQRQKKQIRKGGTLTKAEGSQLIEQANIDAQIAQEMRGSRSGRGGRVAGVRLCGRCRLPGHRIQTCPEHSEDEEDTEEDSSDFSN
jgi:hypothetical protein